MPLKEVNEIASEQHQGALVWQPHGSALKDCTRIVLLITASWILAAVAVAILLRLPR